MVKSHASGSKGESEILKMIRCPNCQSPLMPLPPYFPLFDVQCTRCLFRAQVKTARCAPKSEIFGAGWDVLDKNLKAGHLIPPLIVNFEWQPAKGRRRLRKVYFFPFLAKKNLRHRKRSRHGKRPGYEEFNYIKLLDKDTPQIVLFDQSSTDAKV
jgi:hypothetical protein